MQWITAEPSWFSSGAYRITLKFLEWDIFAQQRFYLSFFSSLKKNFDAFFTQRGAVYSQICTQMNIKELFWVKRIIIIIQLSICTIIATFSWCWFSSRLPSSRACCSWHFVTTNFWNTFCLWDVAAQLPSQCGKRFASASASKSFVGSIHSYVWWLSLFKYTILA